MIRHTPFWFDRYPKSQRRPYPRHRGQADAGVVIVGGGLTGAACAWAFASAGVRTVLLEADRIGSGTTAGALGLLREDFDAVFQETASAHGLRAARLLWQGQRRASLDCAATLRRLQIRCDLTPQDLLLVARSNEDAKALRRDYQARRDAGFDHSWLTPRAVEREGAVNSGGAIRTRGGALDPYRACVGLAAAAAARGADVFERSSVTRIRARSKHVDVTTDGGGFRADAVVIATGASLADLRSLRRHFRAEQGYAVVTEPLPAAVRRQLGQRAAAIRDTAPTPHFLRWLKDDRVLFAGADQAPVPARAREKTLVQRTGQLMYELSVLYPAISGAQPEWSWDFGHHTSVDGLPCIGVHRNFPRHLFALGHGRHGAGTAWLAARLLLRHYRGELEKGDEFFGFARLLGS
jgi:glycine/D-amino acid oxidase-like deaminating enzyme